ncbi:MAG: damage-inducible protein [Pseudomonadota bacterium]|nr:MAG: damage-inducible protein [Pseudomonadota bacterium]
MQADLLKAGEIVGPVLIERGDTLTVTETSTGGLIAAILLAVPGASAYFKGATVPYSLPSRRQWLVMNKDSVADLKPMSEAMAMRFAEIAKDQLDSTWGIAELGIAGPTGAPYGVAAGTSVIAVAGPNPKAVTVVTGHADRQANMQQFAQAAITLWPQRWSLARSVSREGLV